MKKNIVVLLAVLALIIGVVVTLRNGEEQNDDETTVDDITTAVLPDTNAPDTIRRDETTARETTVPPETEDPDTIRRDETTARESTVPPETEDPEKEWNQSLDKKHPEMYFSLSYSLADLAGDPENMDNYIEMFGRTADLNYGAFVEYFQIDKEAFIEKMNELWDASQNYLTREEFESAYFFELQYDVWFSDGYEDAPIFLIKLYEPPTTASVRIRCETDEIHTNRYYTIDYRLIDHVTPAAFEAFRAQFGGTEEFNILHFIAYFEIDRDTYLSLYRDVFPVPYETDYLYGTEEMQERYFCRQPVHA